MNLKALRVGGARQGTVLRRILLVMKLVIFLLLVSFTTASATTFAQKITLNEKNASLQKILKEIHRQSGYDFFYNDDLFNKAKPVTVRLTNAGLEQTLKAILEGQPITYEIEEKAILLKVLDIPIPAIQSWLANMDIRGRVIDEQKKGMPGVTVQVKGSTKATISGSDGAFVLKGVDENALLTFSFIGYTTKEVKAKAIEWLIELEPSTSKLDEVQIQAYGITSQRFNTGDISTVKSKAIEKQPVTNPLQALQGRVPGLEIIQQTGVPGSAFKVQIRGQNSIANGSEPLYVIDGVPYTTNLLMTQGQSILRGDDQGTAGSTLNYLNLGDIESIDVLKDAAATSIYGSRGANGVILISTKKGKAGPLSVKLNISSGISRVNKRLDLLNTQQYRQMRKEAFKNDNVTMTNANAYDVLLYDSTRNTDWQKTLIGNNAGFSNVDLALSGGNTNTQYNISGLYNRQTTVFPSDYTHENKGVNFNISSTSANSRFSLLFSGSYLISKANMTNSDLTSYILLAPNAPDMVNADGSLNFVNNPTNYMTTLRNIFKRSVNNLVSNLVLGYQVLPGLDLKYSFGYTNIQLGEVDARPGAAINPAQIAFLPRASAFTSNQSNSWIMEPQVNFAKVFGRHRLNLVAGMSFQSNNATGQILSGSGYTNDNQLFNIQAAPSLTVSNQAMAYRYAAVFAHLNYTIKDKYLIDIAGRRDGSSRFGAERRFSNFGSAGLGWIFSQEQLFRETMPFLSFGKLRTSYGVTGNDQVSDYRYMTLYGTYYTSYQDAKGLTLDNLANPELAWEKTNKLEVGLDLGFYKDRLLLTVNYYRNRSSNQLLAYPLSTVTGFEAIDRNFDATVQNKGWEFILTAKNFSRGAFTWTTSANLSLQRNKLVAFPGLANSSYASFLIIGKPVYIGRYYQYAGVNSSTGVYEFLTANGTKSTYPTWNDRIFIADRTPAFSGGLLNTLTYKGFDLDFLFQFVKQQGVLSAAGTRPGVIGGNQFTSVLNRWQQAGDVTDIQRFSRTTGTAAYYGFLNYNGSSAIITDASFIRLKNLSLGYSLPDAMLRKLGMKQARISIQGQNLLTITPYKGLDPESQSLVVLPPLFTLTAGLQVTF